LVFVSYICGEKITVIMYRYFIKLAFVGTRYHGWQAQENAFTVQEQITSAIRTIEDREIHLTGCGRTDAGVHAREFYAHFDSFSGFPEEERLKLIYRLNSYLPEDIVILDIIPVLPEAHARFSATSRTYKYYVSSVKDPFNYGFSYRIFCNLNVELMNLGAEFLMNCSDFSSFAKSHTDVKTNICDLKYARWEGDGEHLTFTVTSNRFLRNMVRAMAGTLLDLGKGNIDIVQLRKIVETGSRSAAGYSVPACGLFLTEVRYPAEIFLASKVSIT